MEGEMLKNRRHGIDQLPLRHFLRLHVALVYRLDYCLVWYFTPQATYLKSPPSLIDAGTCLFLL